MVGTKFGGGQSETHSSSKPPFLPDSAMDDDISVPADDTLLASMLKMKGKALLFPKIRKRALRKARCYTPRIAEGTDEGLLIPALLEDDITSEEIERRFGANCDCNVINVH